MKRYAVIFGTRPEGIKLFPLVKELRKRGGSVLLLSTGQHTEMLCGVCEAFSVWPDRTLTKRCEEEGLVSLLSRFLCELDRTLLCERLDGVIVQGDTLSAHAGALWAFLSGIPVFHVEAGLRSHNPLLPYPEEMHRRSITTMASLHFAPTVYARENLLREGVTAEKIHLVGNTVIDAMRYFLKNESREAGKTPQVLLTLHRRETLGDGHREMLTAVGELARLYPDIRFLFPMHENPKIRKMAREILGDIPNVSLADCLPPNEFYKQLFASRLVLTDSGGVQEEAALLGIPTLVLRECTEREAELRRGAITLVGTRGERIVSHAREHLEGSDAPERPSVFHRGQSPSALIAEHLIGK